MINFHEKHKTNLLLCLDDSLPGFECTLAAKQTTSNSVISIKVHKHSMQSLASMIIECSSFICETLTSLWTLVLKYNLQENNTFEIRNLSETKDERISSYYEQDY